MYRDPATGVVGPPAAALQRQAPEAGAAAATAGSEPVIEPVQGPAGGFKVRLGTGQRAAVVRRLDGAGGAVHECVNEAKAGRE